MKTLVDIKKEITVCDEETITQIYKRIIFLLKEIAIDIKKHSTKFTGFPLGKHPVSVKTTLAITELRIARTYPPECLLVKKHAYELITKLIEFKGMIGTPFCNTPAKAYELLEEQIYQGLIRKEILKEIKIPAVKLEFTELYKFIIEQQAELAKGYIAGTS